MPSSIAPQSTEWACRAWADVPSGCPTEPPVLGTACGGSVGCDYEDPCGVSFWGSYVCTGGAWAHSQFAGDVACVSHACGK